MSHCKMTGEAYSWRKKQLHTEGLHTVKPIWLQDKLASGFLTCQCTQGLYKDLHLVFHFAYEDLCLHTFILTVALCEKKTQPMSFIWTEPVQRQGAPAKHCRVDGTTNIRELCSCWSSPLPHTVHCKEKVTLSCLLTFKRYFYMHLFNKCIHTGLRVQEERRSWIFSAVS